MPKWVVPSLLILGSLALLPLALITRARAVHSTQPRIHIIQDMDNQAKFKPQKSNPIFADGRELREPVPGTVARGQLDADDSYYRGLDGEAYTDTFPIELTPDVLKRGQQRFNIYCAPCHGLSGYGNGMVAKRAEELQQGTWVPPASFHAAPANTRNVGHIFNTITNGIRTMPAYGPQIPVEDRWAIVAYVRALQRSQKATIADVPADERESLR